MEKHTYILPTWKETEGEKRYIAFPKSSCRFGYVEAVSPERMRTKGWIDVDCAFE